MGPFRVEDMVGLVAVHLQLPPQWSRIHNVFHVHVVKQYLSREQRPNGLGITPPPPVAWHEGEPLYEFEALLDHRVMKRDRRQVLEFLVRWKGYSSEHDTWEPREDLLAYN
eukprot:679004-Pelagomonas_calceolata.AAC.1